jgi:MoxR-like ATPase
MAHSDLEANRARAGRGGTLRAARASLAAKKAEMVERYGLQAELPTLDSVEALGAYLASVAARVEARQLSPSQGNTLVAVVKQSAALLGLSLDIKLAEQLDAQESR